MLITKVLRVRGGKERGEIVKSNFNRLDEFRNSIIDIMKDKETDVVIVNLKVVTFYIIEYDTALITMDKLNNGLDFYTLEGKHTPWLSGEMPVIVEAIEILSVTPIRELKIEKRGKQ